MENTSLGPVTVMSPQKRGVSIATLLLGVWVLSGPQALAYTSSPLRWNDFALGWATIALSILGATAHDRFAHRRIASERDTIEEHRRLA